MSSSICMASHDFTTEYVVGNVRGLDRMAFGAKSPTDPILAKASPINHITADDPPFLILHGDMDPVIPYTQSVDLSRSIGGGRCAFHSDHRAERRARLQRHRRPDQPHLCRNCAHDHRLL